MRNKRNLFKSKHFSLWIIIKDIIKSNQLTVKIVKTTAHKDNQNNNRVDKLAKERVDNENQIILMTIFNDNLLRYIPSLYNIQLELYFRTLYKEICNYRNHLKWLFNKINDKYRILNDQIDWTCTYKYLNNDIDKSETSFISSNNKKKKIKTLMELLPTYERQKISCPELLKGWLRPLCVEYKETFNHI